MNKKKYLNELRKNLKDFPPDELKDILLDYEEHFDVGVSKGKTEEEISMELGDPRDIANNFKSNAGTTNYSIQKKYRKIFLEKKIVYTLIAVLLVTFGAISLMYNNYKSKVEIGKHGIYVKDGHEQVSIGPYGIKVDDGNEKVLIDWKGLDISSTNKSKKKDKGRSLTNLGTDLERIKVDEEKMIKINDVKEIDIVSDYIDIKTTAIDIDEIKIKLYGEMEANTVPKLKIKEAQESTEIVVENEKRNYNIASSDVVLEVFLPEKYIKNLTIIAESSNIDVRNIKMTNLKAHSSSGDIYAENLSGENLNIESDSGDLVSKSVLGKIDLTTSSGDIQLDNKRNNSDTTLESSSGDISVVLSESSNYTIKGFSSSGEIKSSFPAIIKEDSESQVEATIGKGENIIEIETSSGDIKLIKE